MGPKHLASRVPFVAALVTLASGCLHAYQRDPHYARARLIEVLTDPFHPNNLKYTAVGLALAVVIIVGLAFVIRTALRRRARSRPEE